MKKGKLQKMISVRDLLRNMRTHSMLAVGTSVALVTVLCGTIASNVLGTIEADASSIETNTLYLAEKAEEETRAIEGYVAELRERMTGVQEALDVMEQAILSGREVVVTIERMLGEIECIDKPVKDAFAGVAQEMDTVQGYIDTDREQTGEVLTVIRETQTVTPAEEYELETMEEQVKLSTELVTRHYTVLVADVAAVTDKLRTYEVKAKPFTSAIRTLETCFSIGMRGVEQAKVIWGEDGNGTDDTTALMLARLQLSMGGMDDISDSVDASGEVMEALCGQVQTSTDTLYALQQEIAQTSARLNELTVALDGLSGDILSTQKQVSGAVQAGEAGREEMVRMGQEQRDAMDDAFSIQQKAWDEAAGKQQDTLDAATLKQQEALDAAVLKQQESLDAASAEQLAALERAAEEQKEVIESSIKEMRGDGYVTVTFEFKIDGDTSYTFDFSRYLSNYGAITKNDILVHGFYANTSGSSPYYMGISSNINMSAAVYDPSTGQLVVTQQMLQSPLGSYKGGVTFAVIGGIRK